MLTTFFPFVQVLLNELHNLDGVDESAIFALKSAILSFTPFHFLWNLLHKSPASDAILVLKSATLSFTPFQFFFKPLHRSEAFVAIFDLNSAVLSFTPSHFFFNPLHRSEALSLIFVLNSTYVSLTFPHPFFIPVHKFFIKSVNFNDFNFEVIPFHTPSMIYLPIGFISFDGE